MTRLGSIGPRAVHQPLTLAIYDTLEGNTDWDYVPGAALAALTAGNTLNVTSRHHKVSIVGGTIDNIADAAGATEGQLLELYATAATTIRNNGGGAGNIRTISGQDLAIAANDIVELVYDGANWRECARTNVNLPTTGQIVWGSLADTNLYRAAGGVVKTDGSFQVASTVTTGGTAFGTGGGGNAGVYVDNAGRVQSTQTVNVNILASSRTTDTQFRFTVDSTGSMSWGPGGSTAPDTGFGRMAAGILGSAGTALSTGPTSTAAGGGGVVGALLNSDSGLYSVHSSAAASIIIGSLTTDSQYRFRLDHGGGMFWGPGGSTATDTTLARGAAGILVTAGRSLESASSVSQAAGTTWTPTLNLGLVQRCNVTSVGTLTIGSPGAPPANFTGFLVLIVHNSSGGTITLAWNAAFNTGTPPAPANGTGLAYLFVWNPGTSKWLFFQNPSE